jgi:hypothetical protein
MATKDKILSIGLIAAGVGVMTLATSRLVIFAGMVAGIAGFVSLSVSALRGHSEKAMK